MKVEINGPTSFRCDVVEDKTGQMCFEKPIVLVTFFFFFFHWHNPQASRQKAGCPSGDNVTLFYGDVILESRMFADNSHVEPLWFSAREKHV